MANKVTTGLLKSAFGSATKSGPKKGEGSGDTQHGELANTDTPKKTKQVKGQPGAQKQARNTPPEDFDLSRNGSKEKAKSSRLPRKAGDHSLDKVLPKGDYDFSRNDKGKEAPMDKVMRHAHQAKVMATRRWIEDGMSSEEHDAVHRRANSVLRTKGRRP